MKMIDEIDLDWIDENSTVDDAVKEQIAAHVANVFHKDESKRLTEIAAARVEERVDVFVNEMLNRFMNHEVRVTDNYGDTKAHYSDVEEMVKEKFDAFLVASVDEKGNERTNCSYGKVRTRVDYMIDQRIKNQAEEFIAGVTRDVDRKIKAAMNQQVKDQLSEALLSKIDLTAAKPAPD